jgi:dTDP-4-dehydrorhamnose reductase
MKILVSGGGGKFAKELQLQNSNFELILLSKEEMDITNLSSINDAITKYNPDVFIHAAALSRPMILHDTDPAKSIQLNIIGTSNCVLTCLQYNIKLVYISTDFVYPGIDGNYKETDPIRPVNKYAWSKLGGECSCMLYENSLILRIGMFAKPFPHDKAFVDSFKSPIWNDEAAKITLQLIELGATGIYNIGGEKKSIYDFVIREKNNILKESKDNIKESVPSDISMDLTKLNNILI